MTPINVVPEPPDRTVRISENGLAASVRADDAKLSHGLKRWYALEKSRRTGEWSVYQEEGMSPFAWVEDGWDEESGNDMGRTGPSELYDLVMREVGAR
jgi:hypothetical protein